MWKRQAYRTVYHQEDVNSTRWSPEWSYPFAGLWNLKARARIVRVHHCTITPTQMMTSAKMQVPTFSAHSIARLITNAPLIHNRWVSIFMQAWNQVPVIAAAPAAMDVSKQGIRLWGELTWGFPPHLLCRAHTSSSWTNLKRFSLRPSPSPVVDQDSRHLSSIQLQLLIKSYFRVYFPSNLICFFLLGGSWETLDTGRSPTGQEGTDVLWWHKVYVDVLQMGA